MKFKRMSFKDFFITVRPQHLLLAALAASEALPAYAEQGDILARVRLVSVQPAVHASNTLSTVDTNIKSSVVPELDFTYMATNHIGIEMILGSTRNTVTSDLGKLGKVSLLPPTITAAWHFNPQGHIRPYVGAGLNYTRFYKNDLKVGGQSIDLKNDSVGPALQLGVDIQVTPKFFINADVKKLFVKTDAAVNSESLGTLNINPWLIGVGVGTTF